MKRNKKPIVVYTDGTAGQAGGKSGCCYVRPGKVIKVIWFDRPHTCNEAEYKGVKAAVSAMPIGASVLLFTDSELIARHFSGRYQACEPRMAELFARVKAIAAERDLDLDIRWIPRNENIADYPLRLSLGLANTPKERSRFIA